MTEERIGFGSRPFYGFALPLFLPHEAFFETAPLGPSENVFSNRARQSKRSCRWFGRDSEKASRWPGGCGYNELIADTRTDLE
jgi:hypothetical protein